MSKIVQAFLSGLFFTFILDFFLFLGIKLNYINTHHIDLYYNILFADHQNFIIFFLFTLLIGYLTLYTNTKIALVVVGTLFLLTLSTLIKPIGMFVGEQMLMSKDTIITTDKYTYRGDIYYNGRDKVSFYDYRFKKILNLDKSTIQSEEK